MPVAEENLLGVGLYSPSEAARYARVSGAKYSRWIYGPDPVFDPQLGKERRIVTFLDFAQSLSVYDIRLTLDIPLQKIRAAYRRAQQEHRVEYPFAAKHGIFVFGNLKMPSKCELGIFLPNSDESEAADKKEYIRKKQVQLTGKHKGNQLINEIVQQFSKNLIFHEDNGLADSYLAYEARGFRIIMDRNVRFGKPYLEGLGYEAETLADAARIERTVERAAKIYDVDPNAIRTAQDYYKFLYTEPTKKPPKPVAA